MLEVEAVPQSCIPLSPDCFEYCSIVVVIVYMISLLLVESFDLFPSNQ
jgi:hypothetical protein